MIYTDIIQGTEDWFDIKRGKISASHISDIQAKGKGVTRKNYAAQIIGERLSGKTEDSYTSNDMLKGIEREPDARLLYEEKQGVLVEQVGFIDHPFIANFGCSPDGMVTGGMVEIKCVKTSTMIEYLTTNTIPNKYVKQMLGQLATQPDRTFNDFIAYCPELGEKYQLLIIRLERDDDAIREIESDVIAFDTEVISTIKKLEERET
jgi:hypothetical protein